MHPCLGSDLDRDSIIGRPASTCRLPKTPCYSNPTQGCSLQTKAMTPGGSIFALQGNSAAVQLIRQLDPRAGLLVASNN